MIDDYAGYSSANFTGVDTPLGSLSLKKGGTVGDSKGIGKLDSRNFGKGKRGYAERSLTVGLPSPNVRVEFLQPME